MAAVADVVVALDGSGKYTTIGAAVADAPRNSTTSRHVIHIKAGIYREYVVIGKDICNLTLVGDGIDRTIISGNRSVVGGRYKTFDTGTVSVDGPGFVAHDLTIENTAGAINMQAVALRSSSDRSAVYRCAINGYQDTLYAKKNTQFYHECRISGTVDFIFGDATAVFQKCTLVVRKPTKNQQVNTITAHGRDNAVEATGFAFQFCSVVADDELVHADFQVKTYLGRPWREFSRVVFMECDLPGLVDPKGWEQWQGKTDVVDMYYGEYRNTGAGADVSGRVNWPGFHVIGDASQAANFTVQNFIQGDQWLPALGVDFTPGLGQ
ncbi:hypothetical protein ACQ4PT_029314 [Festuca glaucescens]